VNNILFIFLIWVPISGNVVTGAVPTASADYLKHIYTTEEECTAAKEGGTQIIWNQKPGHRMIGTKQCTDGTIPAQVSIGTMQVTIETVLTEPGG